MLIARRKRGDKMRFVGMRDGDSVTVRCLEGWGVVGIEMPPHVTVVWDRAKDRKKPPAKPGIDPAPSAAVD